MRKRRGRPAVAHDVGMRQLPTGSVTLFFADVESSTALLERLGTATYAGVLTKLRLTIRQAVARHGGAEVDTQGDAFFSVFPRAEDAVRAAVEVQRSLAEDELHVRMGIHTGTPTPTEEGYVGRDVHRAARVCGVARGGDIILSDSARQALDARYVTLDLGERELRGLEGRVRLHRLERIG
jgi:class 3 adenylate cyclase